MEYNINSNLQTGKPFKTYRKTILGKVYVTVFNSITQKPEGLILKGAKNNEPDSMVDIWTQTEDAFFRRMNRKHLQNGTLIEFEKPENFDELEPEYLAGASDADLLKVLKSRYLAFKTEVNKIISESVLYRMITLARENEMSEKWISVLENRLSEIQSGSLEELDEEV